MPLCYSNKQRGQSLDVVDMSDYNNSKIDSRFERDSWDEPFCNRLGSPLLSNDGLW